MIFWERAHKPEIAARVAIPGDFLPAHDRSDESSRELAPQDWTEMAKRVAAFFEDVDLSVLNCEATLDTADLAPQPVCGLGAHISAPSACLDYLHFLRATVVGIANNHIYDFGPAGLGRTRLAIERRGMIPIGAGKTLQNPPEVFVWSASQHIRVGFWAAARATRDASTYASAGVEPASLTRGRKALDAMRRQGARCCVALLHAGCERTNFPDPEDVALMDTLARCGYDVVTACHSHRISGAKIVQAAPDCRAFCFYGLGSIVNRLAASAAARRSDRCCRL